MKTMCPVLVLIVLGGCQPGVAPLWSQAKPETLIEIDPIARKLYVHNSKDVTIKVAELLAESKDGSKMSVKDLELIDNASNPRLANVEQLKQVEAITIAAMEPLNTFMQAVGAGVSAKLASGASTTTAPVATTQPTTTQPSELVQ
jgi:hypothetical protein